MLLRQFSPEELHRSYWMLAQPTLQEFDRVREEMTDAMDDRIAQERHRLEIATRELSSVSPFQVVRRGYAIVRDENGRIVSDATSVEPNDSLAVELRTGVLDATVDKIRIGGTDHEEL